MREIFTTLNDPTARHDYFIALMNMPFVDLQECVREDKAERLKKQHRDGLGRKPQLTIAELTRLRAYNLRLRDRTAGRAMSEAAEQRENQIISANKEASKRFVEAVRGEAAKVAFGDADEHTEAAAKAISQANVQRAANESVHRPLANRVRQLETDRDNAKASRERLHARLNDMNDGLNASRRELDHLDNRFTTHVTNVVEHIQGLQAINDEQDENLEKQTKRVEEIELNGMSHGTMLVNLTSRIEEIELNGMSHVPVSVATVNALNEKVDGVQVRLDGYAVNISDRVTRTNDTIERQAIAITKLKQEANDLRIQVGAYREMAEAQKSIAQAVREKFDNMEAKFSQRLKVLEQNSEVTMEAHNTVVNKLVDLQNEFANRIRILEQNAEVTIPAPTRKRKTPVRK
jgi:hypothetical protein